MSNKMKKYFLILILIGFTAFLKAYDPGRNQFCNEYQYRLYDSWIEYNAFKSDTQAAFTSTTVKRIFAWDSEKKTAVYYDWKDHLIYNQREDLSKWEYSNSQEILRLLESIIYRLNVVDSVFIIDFLKASKCILTFENKQDLDAIKAYFSKRNGTRFYPMQIEQILSNNDKLTGLIFYNNNFSFNVDLPDDFSWDRSVYQLENKRVFPPIKAKESQYLPKPISIQPNIKEPEYYKTLDQYIKANADRRFQREILNNKVADFPEFLEQEFPDYNIYRDGNDYTINKEDDNEIAGTMIKIELVEQDDGIEVYPLSETELRGDTLFLGEEETYDLSLLEDEQKTMIAPFIPHLLYENRAIGTKLINFLFFHDDVATTVICHGDQREKFEFSSYVEVLLMLGKYWNNHNVSFGLDDFKNINGFIEFRGFIIAENKENLQKDIVEIWYHLDKQYRLDLIMLIVHPAEEE